MAKSVETLTLANVTLVIEVSSIRADLENSSSHRANSHPDGRFYKTGYCWSHGYKVSKNHTSDYFTKRNYGHKEKATRRNPMGGSEQKRGWGTLQEGNGLYNTKLNIPTNVNLVV